jgi:hypothetical protein
VIGSVKKPCAGGSAMPRTSRMVIGDETAVYHVMSRTALDGFPLGDIGRIQGECGTLLTRLTKSSATPRLDTRERFCRAVCRLHLANKRLRVPRSFGASNRTKAFLTGYTRWAPTLSAARKTTAGIPSAIICRPTTGIIFCPVISA